MARRNFTQVAKLVKSPKIHGLYKYLYAYASLVAIQLMEQHVNISHLSFSFLVLCSNMDTIMPTNRCPETWHQNKMKSALCKRKSQPPCVYLEATSTIRHRKTQIKWAYYSNCWQIVWCDYHFPSTLSRGWFVLSTCELSWNDDDRKILQNQSSIYKSLQTPYQTILKG